MKFTLASAGVAAVVLAALPSGAAQAKSMGSCPTQAGFESKEVADLGLTQEMSEGYPSLDGNGDGLTCIKVISEGKWTIFRDNTVGR